MGLAMGFDIGGTFTDFVMLATESNEWFFNKVRTTPKDRSAACIEGVQSLLGQARNTPDALTYVAHGSTVVTNVLIERKGAKTALVTTKGFRDVLEIRRQVMPHRYDVRVLKPEPFVPRPLRLGVTERVLADGSVESPLEEDELRALLAKLRAQGVEAIAVAFLHAYANPVNERRAYALASSTADWYVCASHQVLNEFREYERTSTAVANAYVAPPVRRYLDRLEAGLRDEVGVKTPLLIFQSNGGVAPTSQARDLPIASVLSGPAAGVVAACAVTESIGVSNFVSLDMGGTSCDVALIRDGRPKHAYEQEIAGWPVRTPRLDIHSVGAGGGSIGWIDQGGLLRVGPQSAGADPGPACYGQGGHDATVTDANVVLGRLNPQYLLGGRMPLDAKAATAAVTRLGARIGLGAEKTATGIIDVVNSTMAVAIRVVSVERGYDPRAFALLAFGGAGPLHACDLAEEMGITTVIVPPRPGVLAALGLLVSDLRLDGSMTRRLRLSESTGGILRETFGKIEKELRSTAAVRTRPHERWERHLALDMRYFGQSHELQVPVIEDMLQENTLRKLATALDAEHERVYGFATPQAEKEIVCFRVALQAPAGVQSGALPRLRIEAPAEPDRRAVFFKDAGWIDQCPVFQRDTLSVGSVIRGPVVIEQMDTTVLVTRAFQAAVDEETNLILTPVPRNSRRADETATRRE